MGLSWMPKAISLPGNWSVNIAIVRRNMLNHAGIVSDPATPFGGVAV
jgi:hypothetical protein